jgi:hypothetical protein
MGDFEKGVGIISPYKGQVKMLEKKAEDVSKELKLNKNLSYTINTIDSF